MRIRLLCFPSAVVLVVLLCVAASVAASEPTPQLAPGSKFTIVFPDMPPTFYCLDTGQKIPAQMTVFLPTNYDRNRKHPLLIFLEGGNGGGDPAGSFLVEPRAVFVVPAVPRPAYLQPVVDPTFGTRIVRIADDTGRPIAWSGTNASGGAWARIARHHYSDDQPWNSDGTLLALQNLGGAPGDLYLDGNTYQPRFARPKNYDVGTDRWHPGRQHPHERININRTGTRLEWFDVVRGAQTRCWELPFPVARELEMNPSSDGRFVLLFDATHMFVVDMDPQPPHAPYPHRRIGPPAKHGAVGVADDGRSGGPWLDWASISPSG
ncbi:MAG: hypothetical protein N2689_17845, partial [Verrucomicrobiae bacterium]|nr:hypothetical protein [Verrucomicrobiae bacterium]